MKQPASLRTLLKRVHQDERGAVSLETILIIGAIALPILIFMINYAWPRVKDYFNKGMEDLEEGSDNAANG
jgi:Flp pilus assembly pilin Flp